jgi:hypothetical protein
VISLNTVTRAISRQDGYVEQAPFLLKLHMPSTSNSHTVRVPCATFDLRSILESELEAVLLEVDSANLAAS